MSSSSHAIVEAWYNKSFWLYFLLPLSLIYWLVISIRRVLYRCGLKTLYRSKLPVVVVGNITVGGTGKSPLVCALVESLKEQGYKVGVISRGYGSDVGKDECREVLESSVASEVGDEPLMLKKRLGCPVFISPNRMLSLQALEQVGCDIAIADDGLQHYAMARDIEICVVDGERKLGNQFVLPAVPLRELAGRLAKVDYIVVNGTEGGINGLSTHVMTLVPDEMISLDTSSVAPNTGDKIHAVAGIGNPDRFFNTLRKMGFVLETHAFDDHHAFQLDDFVFNDLGPIIMTEKDAVKCLDLGLENAWYLPVRAQVDSAMTESLVSKLKEKGYLNG